VQALTLNRFKKKKRRGDRAANAGCFPTTGTPIAGAHEGEQIQALGYVLRVAETFVSTEANRPLSTVRVARSWW